MSILNNLILKNKKKDDKLIYCLKKIFGLGLKNSILICTILGYDHNIKLSELSQKELLIIDNIIILKYEFILDFELKNKIKKNILNLMDNKSYKGVRHEYHLPVNGQNSHNNIKNSRNNIW